MINAAPKTVADPCDAHDSMKALWSKSRAVCRGERFVKSFDNVVDTITFQNLLIPFSPSMTNNQYEFYKAEAELPGIAGQFGKTLVGGLLRKSPTLKLPNNVPSVAEDWIKHSFGKDDSPLVSFMDELLWEEIQTSRAWVFVDYPDIDGEVDIEEAKKIKPYPIIHKAENVINWRYSTNEYGRCMLTRVVVAGYIEEYDEAEYEFHPKLVEARWVHEINAEGFYQIRVFKTTSNTQNVEYQNGERQVNAGDSDPGFVLEDTIVVLANDKKLTEIPAWPLNGNQEPPEPILTPIVDKEVALYNKISRRNHLMYGAATYTPVVTGNITEDAFDAMVDAGLGSWLHNPDPNGKVDVLKPPTESLQDMEKAIAAGYEEIAKLGVRMLAPETGDQSGVALELRNAAQTAQMSSLNTKVSNTMRQIITFMINWRYDVEIDSSDVEFELSSDFKPGQRGPDWLRLATEWYQAGLIPRSVWLLILQQNDMLSSDYKDDEGQLEMNDDELVISAGEKNQMEMDLKHAALDNRAGSGGNNPVQRN